MGDVLAVADSDLWASAFSTVLVLSAIVVFFRYFQLSSFDPVMAASIGMPVLALDYALTICVSLVEIGPDTPTAPSPDRRSPVRVRFDPDSEVIAVPVETENPNVTIIWVYPTIKTAQASLHSVAEPPPSS